MNHLSRAVRGSAIALAAAACVATSLTATADAGTPAGAAPAAPAAPAAAPTLTAAARAAGLEPGNARMGWRQSLSSVPAAPARPGRTATKAFVPSGVLGIDVASYQRNISWTTQARNGKRFAYVKATEGTTYKNPYFATQYAGAYNAGLIHGAYHFASPKSSSGVSQARYFVKNGGSWAADGHTLPGVLDIEYNPYGSTCYGLSKTSMVAWIKSFVTEYKRLTSRDAVIYTTTDWWTRCTGNTAKFSTTNPLWLARYGTTAPGKLPGTWGWATFWQYSASPLDQDRFSSPYTRLVVLATKAR